MAKIMIVICDQTIADFMGKLMTIYGHEPTIVSDSTHITATANSIKPDLILLDFMMPDRSGVELCGLLRANQHLAQIPIVMISAGEDIENRNKAIQAGVNDYVTMPFDFNDLKDRINALITE